MHFVSAFFILCSVLTYAPQKNKKKTGNVAKKNTENHGKTDPQLTEMLCKNIELALTAGYAKKHVIKLINVEPDFRLDKHN